MNMKDVSESQIKTFGLTGCFLLTAMSGELFAQELTEEQRLGQRLYSDTNLSLNRNQSCASCHSLDRIQLSTDNPTGRNRQLQLPAASFVDPDNVQHGTAVSTGSNLIDTGGLNAPSAGYAAFSPGFGFDGSEGLYFGGQFWNGRANSLADQAKGPPTNPVEMAMPSKQAVVARIKENPVYNRLFMAVYGIDLTQIDATDTAGPDRDTDPDIVAAYNSMSDAIGEFEKSRVFSRFDSKFDFVTAGMTFFTEQEQRGFELFTGDRAQCSACHTSDMGTAVDGTPFPPLFTDYTYDNIGVPRNTNIPGNPEPDPGLSSTAAGYLALTGGDPVLAELEVGKHKVMSLRNIEITPPYMHNGVFNTLQQVVHFYNTRDAMPEVCSSLAVEDGFGVSCWPEAEFADTMNAEELGNLGLTADEEADIVAFLKTLTDNYPTWGGDPNVPNGTASPYADTPFPPMP